MRSANFALIRLLRLFDDVCRRQIGSSVARARANDTINAPSAAIVVVVAAAIATKVGERIASSAFDIERG